MDDSASNTCAREILGTQSIPNAVKLKTKGKSDIALFSVNLYNILSLG